MTRPEENLHFWKLMAEEAGCFHQPYPFSTDHARFTFFRQREPNLHYVPHEDFSCTVTLMSGLPASGKDTWLSTNRDRPSRLFRWMTFEVNSALILLTIRDEWGRKPKNAVGSLLRSGTSFAFNATNTMRQTRGRWLDLFADYNARIEIVYVEPPFENLLQQNKARSKDVPEPVIRGLAEKCEPPTWIECHSLVISDGDTDS